MLISSPHGALKWTLDMSTDPKRGSCKDHVGGGGESENGGRAQVGGSETWTYGMLEEYPLIQAVLILGLAIWTICPTHWGGAFHKPTRPLENWPEIAPQQKKYHPWKIYGLEDVFVSFQKWLFLGMVFPGCTLQGTIAPSKNFIFKRR